MKFWATRHPWLYVVFALMFFGACAGGGTGGGVSVGTGLDDDETIVDLDHDVDYEPRAADLQPVALAFWYTDDTTTTVQKPGAAGPKSQTNKTFQLTLANAQLDFLEMHFKTAALFECNDMEVDGNYLVPVCTSGWVSFLGGWQADLLNATFAPEITGILLPATTYTELRLGLDNKSVNMLLEGVAEKRVDGVLEDAVSFRIEASVAADVRIRAASDGGITIDDQSLHVVGLEIRHSRWFEGIAADLFDCADSKQADFDNEGVLLVAAKQQGACNKIAGSIRSNFASAAVFNGE